PPPPPPPQQQPAVRAESYGQRGVTLVDRFGVWLSRRPVEAVVRRYPAPRLLDVGCGFEATLLRGLAPRLGAGVGVDVRVGDAAKATPNLTFHEAPAESVLGTLADTTFDVVLLVSVLEHLWDPQAALAGCHRLLRPGGSLVVNVPNWLGKRALEFSAFRLGTSPAAEMDDHKMYYAKRDLWPLLVRAGFRPSRIRMRYHKLGLNLLAVGSRQ
ncbi:MAG: Methyltransferase type 11, partial [Phycisphaerales bacterium]|nr:Methyltransferase type 11 [Phycisphaerales bacterium]